MMTLQVLFRSFSKLKIQGIKLNAQGIKLNAQGIKLNAQTIGEIDA
jgi:hypothetical protein